MTVCSVVMWVGSLCTRAIAPEEMESVLRGVDEETMYGSLAKKLTRFSANVVEHDAALQTLAGLEGESCFANSRALRDNISRPPVQLTTTFSWPERSAVLS